MRLVVAICLPSTRIRLGVSGTISAIFGLPIERSVNGTFTRRIWDLFSGTTNSPACAGASRSTDTAFWAELGKPGTATNSANTLSAGRRVRAACL